MTEEKEKTKSGVSRREFIAGTVGSAVALGAMTSLIPGVTAATPAVEHAAATAKQTTAAPKIAGPVSVPSSWDGVADVIVVGLGGAGSAAALTASAAGAKVLVLEKMAAPGGCSAMAAGAFAAAGSAIQKAYGIVDTPGKMFDFWTKAGMGVTDPEVLLAYCENSAEAQAWFTGILSSQTGVTDVTKLWGKPSFSGSAYVTPSDVIPRWSSFSGNTAAGLPGGGAGEFKAAYNAIQKDPNITVMLSSPAVALITDGKGTVVGVQAFTSDHLAYFKANRGVIITTGDFSRNDEMALQYDPFVYYAFKITSLASTGDGIKLGQQVGADLSGMGGDMAHPRTTEVPPGAIQNSGGSWGTNGVPGAANGELSSGNIIFVNNSGQRFVNESTMSIPASALVQPYVPSSWTSYYAGFQIFLQDQMEAWAIFDNAAIANGGNAIVNYFDKDLTKELAGGYVVRANTLADLAKAIGVNATALANTVALWNADAAKNTDSLYARPNNFMQISTPPFYAAPLNWTCDQSFGGLKINGKTQVLDTHDNPVPHLYAAGSATGGINGRFYQHSGGAVGSAYTMGRLAGKYAAASYPV
jgi:succinate dehydrogenase/fumarate reductase flavoprotein subunit